METPAETAIKYLTYDSTHLDCNTCSKVSGGMKLEKYFIKLNCDEETTEFVNHCYTYWTGRLLKSFLVRPQLTYFYSVTDANGILGTGKMFLLSKSHINTLFDGKTFDTMLDIGAGDGNVTEKFKETLVTGKITCTETSVKMLNVLTSKGYAITDKIEGEYDIVCLLNVLDRCDSPVSILKAIHAVKKKYVIISIVLPYRGFYMDGLKKADQLETLIGTFKEWEESVHSLCKEFVEIGFKIEKISRLPYLSEGDQHKEMYKLNTAIFVLS